MPKAAVTSPPGEAGCWPSSSSPPSTRPAAARSPTSGVVECESGDCRARVVDVVRLGDDQALVLEAEQGELHEGERVIARVDPRHRRPTACNHTATHLLHAALRERVGAHVRQAGSYVGPDKLRFDFTHSQPLTPDEVRDIEDRVNGWILEDHAVRAITTSLQEAKALGATALFGEKYGDVVRMVEVGDGTWSRELCGGTHVRTTAEIGVFKITTETSSAANVRRIEAITGPVAVGLLRDHDRVLAEAASALRTTPDNVATAVADREAERRELAKKLREGASAAPAVSADAASEVAGVRVLVASAEFPDAKAMPDAADKLRGQLGDPSVVVLGTAVDGRVALLVSASPGAVERGVKAGAIVKAAAAVVGGGGGGRDTMAQAGGRDPEKLPEALETARKADRGGARRVSPGRESSPWTTARAAAASRSRTRRARWPRRWRRSGARRRARASTGCSRRSASRRPCSCSSGCRSRSPATTPRRRPRPAPSPSSWLVS